VSGSESGAIVVTGGGRGIGAAIAAQLARDGHAVAILDIDGSSAQATAAKIAESGDAARAYGCDIRSRDQVDRAFGRIEADLGHVWALVNNAAVLGPRVPVEEMNDADYDLIMDSSIRGTFNCTRRVLPGMLDCERGNIVNVGSVDCFLGVPLEAVYCSAKTALLGFTRTLAAEYAARGIRANLVCPGAIRTPSYEAYLASEPDAEGAHAELVAKHPVGRIGTPEEVADAVSFLVSERSTFVIGATLMVDGGWTAA
jgi:NAD(P)-dependent dehydrogenase (short-subunit alcohol dehydrogenase family)